MADVEMQGIEFQIVNDSAAASAGVEALARKLAELKTAISGSTTALSKVAAGIAQIKNAVNGVSVSGFESKMSRISASLSKLKTQTDNLKISASIGNQLTEIGKAVKELPDAPEGKLSQLAGSLKPLSEFGKANLSSFITQLGKVPKLVESLSKTDLTKFSQQMKDLAAAMKPLAEEMSQVSAGFSAFPSRIQRLISSTDQYSGTVQRAAGQTNSFGNALKGIVSFALYRKAYKTIASMLLNASKYTETVNLFTASMGEYAKESFDFAKKASDVMGIDLSEWMQNQGVFNTIITGFGVAGDKAAFMSKNLTQLGYDLASFYNTDVASAMQKVQAGISGELEPLRRLGYDLSVAKLQEEATALGITKKVSAMDQAEKSMLRYHAIMTQVTVAQGDMARTLEAPANQLRVLKSQVNLAAREIGNLFIPALNAILPYAIAAMKAIWALAASIGNLFGIQLASVDYSGISSAGSAAEELDKNLSSAGGSAADLKNKLAGFDELNVIQSKSGGGGGAGSNLGLDDFGDIELPGYDFLKDAVSTKINKIYDKLKPLVQWITDHLQEIGLIAGTIGATLLAWRLSTKFFRGINAASLTLGQIHSLVAAGASAVVTIGVSAILENKGLAGGKNENWGKLIASWITSAVGSAVTGKIVKRAFGAAAGKYAAGATLAISTLTSIRAIYDDVKTDGFDLKTLADGIWTAVKGAAAGGLVALAGGASLAVGASIGAGLTLVGLGLALTIANIDVDKEGAKWGNLALTKEEITKYVQEKLFTIDVTATIGAIDSVISDLDSEKGKLNAAIEDFDQSLVLVKLGVDEQGSYQKMLTALTGGATDGSYTDDSILGKLKSVTEKSSVAVKLGFNTLDENGNSRIEISNLIDTSDSIIRAETEQIGKELADLLAKGVNEGLDDNQKEMAVKLSDTLNDMANAYEQGKIAAEFSGRMSLTLADFNADSFKNAISTYVEQREKLRETYQNSAIQTLGEMRGYQYKTYSAWMTSGSQEAYQAYLDWQKQADEYESQMAQKVDNAVSRDSGAGLLQILQTTQKAISDFKFELPDLTYTGSFYDNGVLDTGELADMINNWAAYQLQDSFQNDPGMFDAIQDAVEQLGISYLSFLPESAQQDLIEQLKAVFGSEGTMDTVRQLAADTFGSFATGFADDTLNTQTGLDAGGNFITGLDQNDWAGAGARAGAAYAAGFSRAAGSIGAAARVSNARMIRARNQIKGYATGGYPQSGELFWARENGTPEMVGKMGGSTAVANNDQIVSGIASGVASANEESNALLREQNELLRRLLQKEFTAEVSPSAEFGRVVAKSSRLYEKTYG